MDLYKVIESIGQESGNALNNFEEKYKENLSDENDIELYELLKNICSMNMNYKEKDVIFKPRSIFEGERIFSLEDLIDDDLVRLKGLDINRLPLEIRARVTDVLWCKKRDYEAAQVAARSYSELFEITFHPEHWTKCIQMLTRALTISSQIGKKKEIHIECCQKAYDILCSMNGADKLFCSISIMQLLLEHDFGELDCYLDIVNKIIANNTGNMYRMEDAFDLKTNILSKKKDRSAVVRNKIEWAQCLEEEALKIEDKDFRGLFDAQRYLKKAIKIYSNNGASEDAERALKQLLNVQKELPKMMIPSKTRFDATDLYKRVSWSLEGLSFKESIIRLSQFTRFYSQEELKRSILEGQTSFFAKSMFGTTILGKEGQTIVEIPPLSWTTPEENPEVFKMHMNHTAFELEEIEGQTYLKWCIENINKRYDFVKSDLEFLVKDNPIIPDGRESVFLTAMYIGLKGEVYEALHILAPQTENLFRNLAKEAGGLTVHLENDGSSKEKVLRSVFNLPELTECYDNDILFVFQGLLNERTGANIRNNIAHGIGGPELANRGSSIYFLCAIIKLLLFTSLEALDLLKNSKKLKDYSFEEGEIEVKQVK